MRYSDRRLSRIISDTELKQGKAEKETRKKKSSKQLQQQQKIASVSDKKNIPVKWHTRWVKKKTKQNSTICCLQENHFITTQFKYKDIGGK